MTDSPPPTDGRTIETDAREWRIAEGLDAFRGEHGRPGEHKRPVTDLLALYTLSKAWDELDEWERRYPRRDFSTRHVMPVRGMLEGLGR